MYKFADKLIKYTFYLQFLLLPIIFFPFTSELFEFNKIVFLYLTTSIIFFSWVIKSIAKKKITFAKTPLDISLVIFLVSQIISTLLSIDKFTSLFGYYTRFNGGLLSVICYSILYWAFVSNMSFKNILSSIRYLLYSSFVVSLYAILQRMGADKNFWVQDSQLRVFSTFGQPNWLAAWIVAIIPLGWNFITKSKTNKYYFWIAVSILQFTVLLFSKSRSGLLGFIVADFLYWVISIRKSFKTGLILNFLFLILALIIGTPANIPSLESGGPARNASSIADAGGTESGDIRKIVWSGAIDIWKHSPIFGSGVETFAYSYWKYRPLSHNSTSEWDFVYNKAHNEYLNYLATTGIVGIVGYLFLITASIMLMARRNSNFNLALLSGYSSILVTNFFGFSVVPVSFVFFLFPAMAAVQKSENGEEKKGKLEKLSKIQKLGFILSFSLLLLLIYSISRYWYADYLFAKAKIMTMQNNFFEARSKIIDAIKLSPHQPIYYNELANVSANLALLYLETHDINTAKSFSEIAVNEVNAAIQKSPNNVSFYKTKASILNRLTLIDGNYQNESLSTLENALTLAPTDPKLYFNMASILIKQGKLEDAKLKLKYAIYLKPDYKEASLSLQKLLEHI